LAVSIHTPAGGATPPMAGLLQQGMFQSTRPQGARPHNFIVSPPSVIVSIHAPAGGATTDGKGLDGTYTVSIHAPAGGATDTLMKHLGGYEFQSTRPQGARR